MPTSYDVNAVRTHFPALADGLARFDGPGGSLVPDVVADAVRDALVAGMCQRDPSAEPGRRTEQTVQDARAAMGRFLGTDPGGVVFGRSTTALTFDLARTLSRGWGPGDEVVVSRLDHDANVRPWVIAAERAGATVRWLEFDVETTEPDDVGPLLSDRTRVVAVTGASNLLGTRPDVAGIAAQAHEAGALVFVDAVHLAAHAPVDRAALGADVVTCSPYKFCGPHLGVLAADPAFLESLDPDKLAPAPTAAPDKFEVGTLSWELLAGVDGGRRLPRGPRGHRGGRRARAAAAAAPAGRPRGAPRRHHLRPGPAPHPHRAPAHGRRGARGHQRPAGRGRRGRPRGHLLRRRARRPGRAGPRGRRAGRSGALHERSRTSTGCSPRWPADLRNPPRAAPRVPRLARDA